MPLLSVVTNRQIDAKAAEDAEHRKEIADIANAELGFADDLAAYIRTAMEKAIQEKRPSHQQMVESLNQIHGEYNPDKLASIRELGSEVYPLITDVKCRTTVGIIRRILKEKPWEIEPTPSPTLTPDLEKMAEIIFMDKAQEWIPQITQGEEMNPQVVQQQLIEMMPEFKKKFIALQKKLAKEKAKMMEEKIDDQLVEGGWYKALNDAVEDLVKLKACILKGPIYRKKTIRTIKADNNGKAKVGTKEEIIGEWDAPSPFDIYPLPGVTDIRKGPLIEKLRYTRKDLQDMIGLEGFDETAIRAILGQFYTAGLHTWDWDTGEIQRKQAEGQEVSQYYDWDTIDCLEYHGPVPGRCLIQFANIPIKSQEEIQVERVLNRDIDRDFDYDVVAWLIDQWIIKVTINDNPLGLTNYYKSSYVGEKGAFWGRGLPETIKDSQQMCAQQARAIANNSGIASGPVVSYDQNSLPTGMNFPEKISPWMILPMARKLFATGDQKLIEFYQANMHVGELLQVYEAFSREADKRSVPGSSHGDPNEGGVTRTASGYSMFLGQQSVNIEDIFSELDENIIEPSITAMYWENYDLDEALEYIGDVKIRAKGTKIVMQKQQQLVRLQEWGRTTANPYDMEIIGDKGRRYYLKETSKQMALDPDEAVPDEEMTKRIEIPQKGMVPTEGGQRLDQAGNPIQGTDNILPVQQGG